MKAPTTLAVDVGGTGIKAALLDAKGRMTSEHLRVPTPYPCLPDVLLDAIAGLAEQLPGFDRVSLGFPGVVRDGRVVTAPHFGNDVWREEDLSGALADRLGKPARILNDAEVQGLGIVKGRGLEVVLTLGTGLGSAVFCEGRIAPHLELAHHPVTHRKTYNDYIGDAALHAIGKKRWNRRLVKAIGWIDTLLNYDRLYLGGGNSRHVAAKLAPNVRLAGNDAGLTGGIRLWDGEVWGAVPVGEGSRRTKRRRIEA
jgi:polyphosphate glucokinase